MKERKRQKMKGPWLKSKLPFILPEVLGCRPELRTARDCLMKALGSESLPGRK